MAELVGLSEIHTGRLAEQLETPDIFHGDGLEVELNILQVECGFEIDVAGGISVACAGEVGPDRQMTPTARLDVLGVPGRSRKQERQAKSCQQARSSDRCARNSAPQPGLLRLNRPLHFGNRIVMNKSSQNSPYDPGFGADGAADEGGLEGSDLSLSPAKYFSLPARSRARCFCMIIRVS